MSLSGAQISWRSTAVGAQDGTIRTLFRPTEGLDYWKAQVGP